MPVVKVPMMELMRVAKMKVFYDGNELLDSTTKNGGVVERERVTLTFFSSIILA